MVLGVAAMRLRRLHDVQIHVEGHLRNRSSPSVTIALHRGQFDHGSEVPGSGALLGQDSGRSHWPIVLARGLLEWRARQTTTGQAGRMILQPRMPHQESQLKCKTRFPQVPDVPVKPTGLRS